LLISKAVNYGNVKMVDELLQEIEEEQKMITAFMAKLNK
jgi:hypothetical protein